MAWAAAALLQDGQADGRVREASRGRSALCWPGRRRPLSRSALPGVPAGGRGALAATWMPGRLMELARMESLCPGFEAGFRDGWLASALRREEGSHLLGWASPAGTWLGCTREKEQPLWMLAGKKGTWFLEPLSIEDHATYCFKGGDEVPALVSRLLCAPAVLQGGAVQSAGGADGRQCRARHTRRQPELPGAATGAFSQPGDPPEGRVLAQRGGEAQLSGWGSAGGSGRCRNKKASPE